MQVRMLAVGIAAALALAACSNKPADPALVEDAATAAPEAVAMRAFGNEPFWAMTDDGNGTLTFTTPDNPDGDGYAATRSEDAAGIHYSGADVKLDIVKGDCSDGMSDATHPYTATMTLKGVDYTGCAAPAADVMPAEGDGSTVVSSYHANGFSPAWTADLKTDKLSFEVPDFAGLDSSSRTITVEASAYAKGVDYTGKDGDTEVAFSIKDGPCDKAGVAPGEPSREFHATLQYGKTLYEGCADRAD